METKAYKIELLILDWEKRSEDDIKHMIKNVKYLYPTIISIESRDIDFDDNHPLNKSGDIFNEAYQALFKK